MNQVIFINVADLVDPDDLQGRTYRQINAAKTHSIPIGSLVEVMMHDPAESGVRLFVVWLGRDCDQTPLYYLCHDPEDTVKEHPKFRNHKWVGGFSEESLTVIRGPELAK